MKTFNFYNFLDQNGYEKETIRDRTGKTAGQAEKRQRHRLAGKRRGSARKPPV